MLTFDVWNNNSYFCQTLLPPSPLPAPNNDTGRYCPLGPGPFALSSSVKLSKDYALATFDTRLRALDPNQRELMCIDIAATPLKPNSLDEVYGDARIIFWCTVALAIAYWAVVGLARLVSAWGRGSTRNGRGVWARVESAGFILASAISGERLATSPALMRFCTHLVNVLRAISIDHSCIQAPRRCATSSSIHNGAQLSRWWQFSGRISSVSISDTSPLPTDDLTRFLDPLVSQTAWSTLVYSKYPSDVPM